MAQSGQHQVQLLPVVAALGQRRGGLDEQDLAVGVLACVDRRAELVGEQPQGSVVAGHLSVVPRTDTGGDAVGIQAGA